MYTNWQVLYLKNEEFAHCCRQFINKFHEDENENVYANKEEPKQMTLMQQTHIMYKNSVNMLCTALLDNMNQQDCDRLAKAMMHVFESENGFKWFKPRHNNESFNIARFCRLTYILYLNGFYNEASCSGRPFKPAILAHRIMGHETCDDEPTVCEEKAAINREDLKHSTITTYMYDSHEKPFESFCKNILPSNY